MSEEIPPMNTDDGLWRAEPTSISEIMQTAYIDYSMSVIVSRALPDARDGFKPVQREFSTPCCARVYCTTGSTNAQVLSGGLKNYHPHGDTSVYNLCALPKTGLCATP